MHLDQIKSELSTLPFKSANNRKDNFNLYHSSSSRGRIDLEFVYIPFPTNTSVINNFTRFTIQSSKNVYCLHNSIEGTFAWIAIILHKRASSWTSVFTTNIRTNNYYLSQSLQFPSAVHWSNSIKTNICALNFA